MDAEGLQLAVFSNSSWSSGLVREQGRVAESVHLFLLGRAGLARARPGPGPLTPLALTYVNPACCKPRRIATTPAWKGGGGKHCSSEIPRAAALAHVCLPRAGSWSSVASTATATSTSTSAEACTGFGLPGLVRAAARSLKASDFSGFKRGFLSSSFQEAVEMAIAAPGQLNLDESPSWGSRSVDCFEKLEQIGEGTYGQVYMAREIRTGEVVALKKIRMDNEREGFPITAIREIKILKKLHHDNVIRLKEIVTSPGPEKDEQGKPDGNKYKGSIYMVFEYMDHDLTGLSDRPGMRFTVPQIKCYMKQLLTGLHYCHVNQVLHRDIKGSNLLIDNDGNLKLADFGLARSFSSDHNANLTNRVITLWYRPPELLLGATKYGPAVDMWSVGCIFAELVHGKPILPGKNEAEQLTKIFELCGTPDEVNWPGVTKIPWYNNFKPTKPMKRRVREVFKHFDRHALELLERMLTLDPTQRMSAKDALDAEYFWTDPLPCDPKSLPKYESSHEFQTKKKRQQQRQNEDNAKRQKLQHPQPHARLPPTQQTGPVHPQFRPGPSQQPLHNVPPPAVAGPSHHYTKPRGPSGGPSRYPQGGNPSGGYNPNRGQGGGYSGAPYPPQGRGPPPYPGGGMPAAGGPRGGVGSGYGVGAPNFSQGGHYGASGQSRGPNVTGGTRNQQYGWQ